MESKIKIWSFIFNVFFFFCASCSNPTQKESHDSPHILFYLHGRIVEDQGRNAFSERFGVYEYDKIIQRFEKEGFIVKSEVRPSGTDNNLYAGKITKEINELIQKGNPPNHITLVGASKGALITMLVSTQLKNKKINFVIMGNCNNWVLENYDINLHGNILSIYEQSDKIGGESCEKIITNSAGINKFKEIKLNTALGHGFLYRPLDEWVKPTIKWAHN